MAREQWGARPRHSHGDPTSLAPHERLTDLAVVPREKAHTGAAAREQPQDSPVIARWGPSSPAWPRDQSRDLSPNASGGLTPFSPPSELQEIPVATREQSGKNLQWTLEIRFYMKAIVYIIQKKIIRILYYGRAPRIYFISPFMLLE